jgi:biotin transport system substrate-specific component
MTLSRPYILVWTIVGLFLTVGANFLSVYIISAPWQWLQGGKISAYPLGLSAQVGAVLLVACLGGRTAGAFAQIAYVALGLMGLKIFHQGGGIEYIYKPAFGYLLAFIPGAWLCGQLAFKQRPRRDRSSKQQLEHLGLSCAIGTIAIHVFGIIYLCIFHTIEWFQTGNFRFLDSLLAYSIYPFFGQIAIGCAAASLAFVLRRVMLY